MEYKEMMQENKNMITTLIKIKELHIWEIQKELEKQNDSIVEKIYSSLLQTMKSESKILSSIIKFEEKNNG